MLIAKESAISAKHYRPADAAEVAECIKVAIEQRQTLEIVGGATKRSLGNPVAAEATLDLSGVSGIEMYEPEELVIKVGAGTPLANVRAALAEHGQHLAFEPPSFAGLYGTKEQNETVGGIVAGNLSGPRRVFAGSARDAVLGVEGVNGLGEHFKGGGRTVKNVTGYDMPRLMTGSYGVLAALTSVTLKVHPLSEFESTIVLRGMTDTEAIQLASQLLRSPLEISAASHVGGLRNSSSLTAFRLEGFRDSVIARQKEVGRLFNATAEVSVLTDTESRDFWVRQRDLADFATDEQSCIWRLSLPSTDAARLVEGLCAEALFDWGGNQVFVKMTADGIRRHSDDLRRSVSLLGGAATLLRAPATLRSEIGAFQPKSPVLAALTQRLRAAFDPCNILNPGKLVPVATRDPERAD